MDVYQLEERKQIIKWHHQNHPVRKIKELFTATFEDRPSPSISTLHKIIKNFEQHGCVFPTQHKKPPVPDENREMLEIMVCATANEKPALTSLQIAEAVGTSASTVKRILKKNGYHSYKVRTEMLPDILYKEDLRPVGHQWNPQD